jgi:hypothetical protein
MSYPAATSGLGTPAKILVQGTQTPLSTVPGKNKVTISLSGTGAPTSFQLNPQVVDVAGTPVPLGASLTLTAVAASVPGTLTLASVANASGTAAVYTGTITGGGSNAFAGLEFTVVGFDLGQNNGTFVATASSTTTLTLTNAAATADTHAATATAAQGTAVYTGTITGGGSSAFAGKTFNVAGFAGANNNGSYIATASSTTTLTLENNAATAETHAATAVSEEATNVLTYFADGAASLTSGTYGKLPAGSAAKVVSVSSTGLVTSNGVLGRSVVEVSYPVFNNTVGTTTVAGSALPAEKIYADVEIRVVV